MKHVCGLDDPGGTMKPRIGEVRFGTIVIDGEPVEHDIVITLDGRVEKRKKKLSKALYGTSHILSLAEAESVWESGADRLVIGTGMFDRLRLSPQAEAYFADQGCAVELLPTQEAVAFWNRQQGNTIALFHITC